MEQLEDRLTPSFTTGQFLTGSNVDNNYSNVDVGPGNTFYGAWKANSDGTLTESFIKFATFNGTTWSEITAARLTGTIVGTALGSGLNQIVDWGPNAMQVDSAGDIHIVLGVGASTGGANSLRGLAYGKYDASASAWSFQKLFILQNSSGFRNVGNGDYSLALDSSGNPHVVFQWSDATTFTSRIEYAFFNGTSWNVTGNTNALDAINVATSPASQQELFGVDAAFDSSNVLRVSFISEDTDFVSGDVWYTTITGTTVATPTEIVDADTAFSTSLVVNSSDRVSIAYTTGAFGDPTYNVNLTTNASGSFVASNVGTITFAGADRLFGGGAELAITASGQRVIVTSYGASDASFNSLGDRVVVLSDTGSATWVQEIAYSGTDTPILLPSATIRNDNTVMTLFGRDVSGTSRVLSFATGIPDALDTPPDTDPPGVTSLTPNLTTVADANVGTSAFTVTVVFDEPMNTTVNPTVSFPAENPGGALVFNAGASGWTNTTTYVARYNVVDTGVDLADIDIRVTGGRDVAGNTQALFDSANRFSIDTLNPTLTLTGVPLAETNATSASVSFVASGATAVQYRLDGGSFLTATSPISLSGLSEGSHTVDVRATDAAGNTTTASTTWIVDLTAPTASFLTTPSILSNSTSASFTFTGSDPTSGGVSSGVNRFEFELDGGGFSTATSPVNPTGLSDGSHTARVRAIDDAGNVGTAVLYTWTVDTVPPGVSIGTPSVSGTTVSFVVTYSDTNLGAITLAAGDVTVITSGTTFTGVSVTGTGNSRTVEVTGVAGDGTLAISLAAGTASDLAGNTAAAAGPSTPTGISTNDPPVPGSDTLPDSLEDTTVTVATADLLANDSPGPADESAQNLSVVSVGNPVGGSVSLVGSNVVFVPTPDWFGTASFEYTVTDDGDTNETPDPRTAVGTATFDIRPVAEAPAATPATTDEDTLSGTGAAVTPAAADGSEIQFFRVTGITNGSLFRADGVTPVADGEFVPAAVAAAGFRFLPPADANTGAGDTFGFSVAGATDSSGGGLGPTTFVPVTVTAVNDPPTFTPGTDVVASGRAPRSVAWATAISPGPANESGQQLTFEVTTDRPDLFTVQPAIDPATGSLTFTPAGSRGEATVTVRLRDDAGGSDTSSTVTFTITIRPGSQAEIDQFAVSPGDNGPGSVTVFDPTGEVFTTAPFTPDEAGTGVQTATGDVTGDGVPDLIATTGSGTRTQTRVIDGATRETAFTVRPFEDGFTGGATVAVGDVDGDGFADIVVGAGDGGSARVTVYSGRDGSVLADFFGIADENFRGGCRVSLGDVDGDGLADLAVAAGTGGGPRIALWDGRSLRPGTTPTRLVPDFFAFEPSVRNGAYVSLGDLNGDGLADLIFGAGPGGAPRVRVGDARSVLAVQRTLTELANFFAGPADSRTGARVAAKDLNADGQADLLVLVATPTGDVVRGYLSQDIRPTGVPSPEQTLAGLSLDGVFGVFVG